MRSVVRAALGVSVLFAACLAGGELRAEEAGSVTARLEWQQTPGAESCVDSEGLKRAVNQRWGRSVFVDAATADILLHGTVARSGANQWSASIELERSDGTSLGSRELVTSAPDCSSLDDSIALAVGLMLDVTRHRIVEERLLANQDTKDVAPSEGAALAAHRPGARWPAAVDGPAISIPKETAPVREVFHIEPSLGLEVAVGLLPGLGLGVRPGIVLVPPRFVPIEVAVAFFLPDEEHAANGRGARFSAITAEVALCPLRLGRGVFRADTCLTERFGQIRGVGFGFREIETATELVSAAGVHEAASVQLASSMAVFLGLSAEVPFVRYRFLFGEPSGSAGTIYRMPRVLGSGTLGFSLVF